MGTLLNDSHAKVATSKDVNSRKSTHRLLLDLYNASETQVLVHARHELDHIADEVVGILKKHNVLLPANKLCGSDNWPGQSRWA